MFSDSYCCFTNDLIIFIGGRSKWKFYHKKEKKKIKLQNSNTKAKEAEKDFTTHCDFERLWLISIYQNI